MRKHFSRSLCVTFTNLSVGKAGCMANPEAGGEREDPTLWWGSGKEFVGFGFLGFLLCFVLFFAIQHT